MEIRNECSALPEGVLQHARRSLSFIYPPDLVGIGFVRLVDKVPTDVKLYIKEGRIKDNVSKARAFYMPAHKRNPPYVALVVPKILRGVPGWLMRTPSPTLLFAFCVAHEVGHHLVLKRGYALHPTEKPRELGGEYEEEMVDRYASEVVRKMKAQWRYKFGQWLINEVASRRQVQGRLAWGDKNYELAKNFFLQAFYLDPDLENAEECFRIAQATAEREARRKSEASQSTDMRSC
jgi:hypothetical protein